jgi:hypothetical protein
VENVAVTLNLLMDLTFLKKVGKDKEAVKRRMATVKDIKEE